MISKALIDNEIYLNGITFLIVVGNQELTVGEWKHCNCLSWSCMSGFLLCLLVRLWTIM